MQRAIEALQQERDTFDLRKKHEERWFILRFAMGWASIGLITTVMIICCIILINSTTYPDKVVNAAIAALFVDIVGLATAVWKIVMNPSFVTKLEPITRADLHTVSTGTDDTYKEH